ncbi:MAG: 7-carboxy-7-deazaguanine synthase QueE [Candidatus Omnitrophota bacterium]
MMKAKITEIFSSIQGEGPYAGEEQLFIRFFGCDLECSFCDEKSNGYFKEYSLKEVIDKVIKAAKDTVSLTGGEPLVQCDFLRDLARALKTKGFRIYLETNGVLYDELSKVIDLIDIVSMDIKLPSSTLSEGHWQDHGLFLKEAIKKELFVKAVITQDTKKEDVIKACSLVKDIDKKIPFILQPVSYNNSIAKISSLDEFLNIAKSYLSDVRVIPQIHKILGVR